MCSLGIIGSNREVLGQIQRLDYLLLEQEGSRHVCNSWPGSVLIMCLAEPSRELVFPASDIARNSESRALAKQKC